MKKITAIAIFLFSFQLIYSQSKIQSIRFGTGGGFSGAETIYSIDKKGQLYNIQQTLKGASSTFVTYVPDKKKVKQYFEKAKELLAYAYNQPEDTYSFLEIYTEEKTTRIVWSDKTKVDPRVIILYDELMGLIK